MPANHSQLNAQQIKKKTFNSTLQQPVAIYPTSAGVLAGAYLLAFGLSPIAVGVCAGGLALGVGGWLYEYVVRGDRHALKIVNKVRSQLSAKRTQSIERIRAALQNLEHKDGLYQLAQLTKKFKNFEGVLAKKLNVNELTYNRYLAISEQVFLNALDNLEQLTFGLQSVSTIDMASITGRLEQLKQNPDAQKPFLARAELWHAQHQKAKELMLENEQAMTQLDQVTARLAEVRTREGHAQMDMELAMSELESLIKKASQYKI